MNGHWKSHRLITLFASSALRRLSPLADDQISDLYREIKQCAELTSAVRDSTNTTRNLWTTHWWRWWRWYWWDSIMAGLAVMLLLYSIVAIVVLKLWSPHDAVLEVAAVHAPAPTAHQSTAYHAPVANKAVPAYHAPAVHKAPAAHATAVHRAASVPAPAVRQAPAYYTLLKVTALYAIFIVVVIGVLFIVIPVILIRDHRDPKRWDPFTVAALQSQIESRFVDGLARYDDDVIRFVIAELKLANLKLESWPSYASENFKTIFPFLAAFGLGVIANRSSS
jgi:hypothetical protein